MQQRIARRNLLAGSLAAAAGLSAFKGFAADEPQPGARRDIYELQVYQVKAGEMLRRADAYFQNALLPALQRAGAGPVGVFTEVNPTQAPSFHVLITHNSPESAVFMPTKLMTDADFQKAAEAFLKAPPKDPGYVGGMTL